MVRSIARSTKGDGGNALLVDPRLQTQGRDVSSVAIDVVPLHALRLPAQLIMQRDLRSEKPARLVRAFLQAALSSEPHPHPVHRSFYPGLTLPGRNQIRHKTAHQQRPQGWFVPMAQLAPRKSPLPIPVDEDLRAPTEGVAEA